MKFYSRSFNTQKFYIKKRFYQLKLLSWGKDFIGLNTLSGQLSHVILNNSAVLDEERT
jgi:hypothetical protein